MAARPLALAGCMTLLLGCATVAPPPQPTVAGLLIRLEPDGRWLMSANLPLLCRGSTQPPHWAQQLCADRQKLSQQLGTDRWRLVLDNE